MGPTTTTGAGVAPPGLSSAEARRRLLADGENRAPAPARRSTAGRFADQLRDPMILLLEAAGAVSAVLRDWSSTVIIAAVIVFNSCVGVLQQRRADRVMVELDTLAAPVARARRDGALVTLPASDLVRGDLVLIAEGDVVPADGTVVESHSLEVDESPVTGESLPVPRAAGAEVLAGTRVSRGRAEVTLTRTGPDSSLGRVAALIGGVASRPTPLQQRLARLSRLLVGLVVSLTGLVVALGVAQGRPWGEMVLVGLSLTVAAVPESLPAVVTIALALGAHRMAAGHVVVRALPAVETLGSVTVVATDKTGTLTEGRMTVERLWLDGEDLRARTAEDARPAVIVDGSGRPVGHRAGVHRLLRDLALCSDAEVRRDDGGGWEVVGDPLEGALVALAVEHGVDVESTRRSWVRTGEEPFEHAKRRMTSHHQDAHGVVLWVRKGAPEAVLGDLGDPPATEAAQAVADRLAADGLKVIAVSRREAGHPWELAGLVGVGDPPRAAAAGVVSALERAGIRLVMITGDHLGTARAVARAVGIPAPASAVTDGASLLDVPPDLRRGLSVVARVLPEQKMLLVQWLQASGDVAAMVGDGVNDAPALRQADIGVAAGLRGSEVAKQAADLVLTDDDLGSVVKAVEEGRRIYANVRAFLVFGVSGGLAEVAVMICGPLVGLPIPLLPGQILWINLLTHGLVGVAFGAEPLDPRRMADPPRPLSEPVLPLSSVLRVVGVTCLLLGAALVAAASTQGSDDLRRSAVFLALGGGQLGVALALRSPRGPSGPRGRAMEAAVVAALALLVAAVWLPALQGVLGTAALGVEVVLVVLAASAVPGAVLGLMALTARRSRAPRQRS